MINGIGSSGKGRIDLARSDAAQRGVAAVASPVLAKTGSSTVDRPTSTAAALAGLGAPIDAEKIAAIRTAIAEGRYPVNPKAIAEKMIALDLPLKF